MQIQDWIIVTLHVGNFLLNTWSKRKDVVDLGHAAVKKIKKATQWVFKKK
ncbi:hypothetical protein [Saccharibacillus sp. O23]|nr:hypothetical protein [Saccharibacillus sp. O23]